LHPGRILSEPSCPRRQWGRPCAEETDVELTTVRTLLVLALIVISILVVMWLLAATRESSR
jgi:hypothetical protein